MTLLSIHDNINLYDKIHLRNLFLMIRQEIPNKLNYDVWRTPASSRSDFEKLSAYEQLLYLCKLGHLAPSTHNTQPWKFLIDEAKRSISIYLDRYFVLPESDVCGRQSVISVGCALENIIVGGNYFNAVEDINIFNLNKEYVLPYKKIDRAPRYALIALIKLVQKSIGHQVVPKKVFESIFLRKVVRAEYDPQRIIPKDIISLLHGEVDGKYTNLIVLTDNITRTAIAEFQAQADSFVINSTKFSKELGKWLLPNDTNSHLGMPGVGFGLEDSEAQRIHEGLLGKSMLRPDDGLKFSLAGKKYIESSPVILVITITKDDVGHWIRAGRAFEKIFLILTSKGINVAVHAGIVEVGLINKMFSVMLRTKGRIAVLFRAGFIKNENYSKRPHSPRLPIESVILAKNPDSN